MAMFAGLLTRLGLLVFVVLVAVCVPTAAFADVPCDQQHRGTLTLMPDSSTQLTVGATRTGTFTRALLYSLTGCSAPDKPFKFVPVGRLDGPQGTQADLIVSLVEGDGNTVKVTINVPREQLTINGTYSGEIVAKDSRLSNDAVTVIKVQRDPAPLPGPIIAFVVGVLMGLGIFLYREWAATIGTGFFGWARGWFGNLRTWPLLVAPGLIAAGGIGYDKFFATGWSGTGKELLELAWLVLTAFVAAATTAAAVKQKAGS
jgi:hypothetical protein